MANVTYVTSAWTWWMTPFSFSTAQLRSCNINCELKRAWFGKHFACDSFHVWTDNEKGANKSSNLIKSKFVLNSRRCPKRIKKKVLDLSAWSFSSWQQLSTFHCLYGRSEAVTHCTVTFTPLKRRFVYMSLGSGQMGQIQKPLSDTHTHTHTHTHAYAHTRTVADIHTQVI